MSISNQDKQNYPEKDLNNNNVILDKHFTEKNQNIQVYDNDDAYLLNVSDKDNIQEEIERRENISDLDNFDKMKNREQDFKDRESEICEEIDEQLGQRRGFDNLNLNTNPNSEKGKSSGGINSNMRKKENMYDDQEKENSNSNLITLKYISVCQCCKNNFNSGKNTPYLLKCGHFFCKFCLENNYTDGEGKVYCPEDGCMAKNISELRLLNNLIIDKNRDGNNEKIEEDCCKEHPGQKLSHFIEETKEIICVYCAFNKFKKNPRLEIKEIKEKCSELMDNIDKLLNDNQNHVDILNDSLNDIKKNKFNEEQRVIQFYDKIIKYLEERKGEILENVNIIFSQNADKLSEKLDYFSVKMEDAEDLKRNIISVSNGETNRINDIMNSYSQYLREANDSSKLNLELTEYKYINDDENKLLKYLHNFGDLKSKQKLIRFTNVQSNNNQKTNKRNNEINNYKNNLLSSDFLESSHFDELEKEEYGARVNTQEKKSFKNDSKERLKSDLMPNNFDQRRRENHSSYGGNRATNLNPTNDYLANFSGYSNEYGFTLNRYDKNY